MQGITSILCPHRNVSSWIRVSGKLNDWDRPAALGNHILWNLAGAGVAGKLLRVWTVAAAAISRRVAKTLDPVDGRPLRRVQVRGGLAGMPTHCRIQRCPQVSFSVVSSDIELGVSIADGAAISVPYPAHKANHTPLLWRRLVRMWRVGLVEHVV